MQTDNNGGLAATVGRLKIGSEADGDVDRVFIAREILQCSRMPLALTKSIDTLPKLSPVLEDAANRRAFHTCNLPGSWGCRCAHADQERRVFDCEPKLFHLS